MIYTSVIHAGTDISNFTDEQLIAFAEERGFLKKRSAQDEKAIITLLVFPNNHIVLGSRKGDHKLTDYGAAYHKKILVQRGFYDIQEFLNVIDHSSATILAVKLSGKHSLVETTGMLHPAVGYPYGDYYFISVGLTSSKKGIYTILSNVRYKEYEKQKEAGVSDENMMNSEKPQSAIAKTTLQIVHKDNVVIPKWGKEYLASIKQQKFFHRTLENQKYFPPVDFDDIGVTRQEMLDMCLDMDYNSAKSKTHPTTTIQKKKSSSQEYPKNNNNNEEF